MMTAPAEIYAVLIALYQDTLLLPNAAVVEVLSQDRMEAPQAGAPAWLVGWHPMAARRLPVISFEALNGASPPPQSRRARVVVINSVGSHVENAQLALLTQGYPHLVTLTRGALQPAPLRDTDRDDLLLSRVRIATQEAAIPDLEAIEADLLRSAAA